MDTRGRLAFGIATAVILGLLAAFWLQTWFDLTHPPVYRSPWGDLHADDLAPPEGS